MLYYIAFYDEVNSKLFELCNRQLLTVVNDPKQFDYNAIRDDHKSKVPIIQSWIDYT
jgi:hypothetical protein